MVLTTSTFCPVTDLYLNCLQDNWEAEKNGCNKTTEELDNLTSKNECNFCINQMGIIGMQCWTQEVEDIQLQMETENDTTKYADLRCGQFELLKPCWQKNVDTLQKCPYFNKAVIETLKHDKCFASTCTGSLMVLVFGLLIPVLQFINKDCLLDSLMHISTVQGFSVGFSIKLR